MSGRSDAGAPMPRVTWGELGWRARAWRLGHAAWSVAQLAALSYIWRSAITRRRSRAAWASVAFLMAEGAALFVGRGNCPMGARQAEWGDPVPFFELLLPPRAAKAAVPVLAAVSVAGIVALVVRGDSGRGPGTRRFGDPGPTVRPA